MTQTNRFIPEIKTSLFWQNANFYFDRVFQKATVIEGARIEIIAWLAQLGGKKQPFAIAEAPQRARTFAIVWFFRRRVLRVNHQAQTQSQPNFSCPVLYLFGFYVHGLLNAPGGTLSEEAIANDVGHDRYFTSIAKLGQARRI